MNSMHTLGLTREDYEVVLAVADEMSVTRAAKQLHLSQSAVSHHLRALEVRIGEPLFRREPRRMALSPFGEEFLMSARRIIGEMRRADTRLSILARTGRRLLTVGTECYTSYHWLPSLAEEFKRAAVDCELKISLDANLRVIPALLTGEIDLAIVNSPGEHKDLGYEMLLKDEIVLLVAKSHPLARRVAIHPIHLEGEALLLQGSQNNRSTVIDEFLAPAGVFPASVQYVQLTEAIVEMARAGMGVAALARWMILPHVGTGSLKVVRLGASGLRRDWRVAFRRTDPRFEELRNISSLLSKRLRRLL
jgi:LysR family transcriptional regulator, regulator for metE and metH